MTPTPPAITSCSVRVMRSHDYCHFEVVLGSTGEAPIAPEAVDALRKQAARLADKAVEQFKVAKANAERILREKSDRHYLVQRMQRIRETPEGERTVDEQAQLKAFSDEIWEATRQYDYEDEGDWN